MARFVFVVYTNPVAGREAEYNDWYDGQHLDDLRKLPGVVSARRFELTAEQVLDAPQPFRYLALYEVEADDVRPFLEAIQRGPDSGMMPISTALAEEISATVWKARDGR